MMNIAMPFVYYFKITALSDNFTHPICLSPVSTKGPALHWLLQIIWKAAIEISRSGETKPNIPTDLMMLFRSTVT
jgi:hypothetical protein